MSFVQLCSIYSHFLLVFAFFSFFLIFFMYSICMLGLIFFFRKFRRKFRSLLSVKCASYKSLTTFRENL